MNALAIHLYLTITFINLVIIQLAQNYRIIDYKLSMLISWFSIVGTNFRLRRVRTGLWPTCAKFRPAKLTEKLP